MTIMKQAWRITRQEFRINPYLLLWTALFIVYLALTMSYVVAAQLEKGAYLNPVADFVMLMLIPFLGFFFHRRSFRYLREDSYTQMLAYFRIMPVPTNAVIVSRMQQAALAFVMNGVILFGIMFLLVPSLREDGLGSFYLTFVLTWVGYGMLVHGVYIYLEFLKKGKTYFWSTILIMGFVFIFVIGVRLGGGNLLLWTVEFSKQWGLSSPVMWSALVVGVMGLVISSRFTLRRLVLRDLV